MKKIYLSREISMLNISFYVGSLPVIWTKGAKGTIFRLSGEGLRCFLPFGEIKKAAALEGRIYMILRT